MDVKGGSALSAALKVHRSFTCFSEGVNKTMCCLIQCVDFSQHVPNYIIPREKNESIKLSQNNFKKSLEVSPCSQYLGSHHAADVF